MSKQIPKLTISLVTFNHERYIPDFADSLIDQTFTDWQLRIIDNNSNDGTQALLHEYLPQGIISIQKDNLGYSKAHNLNITWSDSPYILVTNPDIRFNPDCIEKMVQALDDDPDRASVGPMLVSMDGVEGEYRIDSTGLELSRSYRLQDRNAGKLRETFRSKNVFGLSGACVMFRREALNSVATPKATGGVEYFDEDFFAYKEDGDLAWRLLSAGWKNFFLGSAEAFHARRIKSSPPGVRRLSKFERRERRSRKSINRFSYRNHLAMICKNQYPKVTLVNLHRILFFELQKFVYLLYIDRSSFAGLIEFIRLRPKFQKKRKQILAQRKLTVDEFKKYLS